MKFTADHSNRKIFAIIDESVKVIRFCQLPNQSLLHHGTLLGFASTVVIEGKCERK